MGFPDNQFKRVDRSRDGARTVSCRVAVKFCFNRSLAGNFDAAAVFHRNIGAAGRNRFVSVEQAEDGNDIERCSQRMLHPNSRGDKTRFAHSNIIDSGVCSQVSIDGQRKGDGPVQEKRFEE